MPLRDLVEYFNQRLSTERGSKLGPLQLRHSQVESRCGDLRLATKFHLFSQLRRDAGGSRRKQSLASVIHRLDTQLLVEGVEDARDVALTESLGADLVAGAYYERLAESA